MMVGMCGCVATSFASWDMERAETGSWKCLMDCRARWMVKCLSGGGTCFVIGYSNDLGVSSPPVAVICAHVFMSLNTYTKSTLAFESNLPY